MWVYTFTGIYTYTCTCHKLGSMLYNAFGKKSGPSTLLATAQNQFAYFSRPPSPTPQFSASPLQRSPREHEDLEITYSPPLDFQNNCPALRPSYPSAAAHRYIEPPPNVGQRQTSFFNGYDAQTPAVPSFLALQPPAKISPLHDLKRNRSPQLLSTDEDSMRNSRSGDTRFCSREQIQPWCRGKVERNPSTCYTGAL